MRQLVRLAGDLTRPAALFIVAAFAHLGLGLAGETNDVRSLAMVSVVVAALLMHAVAVNDLADEAVDRANGLGRALAAGRAGRSTLVVAATTTGATAFASSWLLPWPSPAIVAAGIVFGLVYSLPPIRLSGRGALALALLPVGYVIVPFAVGFTAGSGQWSRSELTILAGSSLGFVGRIILKDFRDLEGDTLHGKRTFLVRYGRTSTCKVSAACWVLAAPTVLALPDARPALVLVHGSMTIGVVACLGYLAVADTVRTQTRLVNGIAILGRWIVVSAIAHLSMQQLGWPSWRYHAAMAALTTWTAVTAFESIRLGPVYGNEPADAPLQVVDPEFTVAITAPVLGTNGAS